MRRARGLAGLQSRPFGRLHRAAAARRRVHAAAAQLRLVLERVRDVGAQLQRVEVDVRRQVRAVARHGALVLAREVGRLDAVQVAVARQRGADRREVEGTRARPLPVICE